MKLEIVLGCMFSGKTSELLKDYHRLSSINKNILVVNHSNDFRSGHDVIKTHDGKSMNCTYVSNALDILVTTKFCNADVILVDEAQFFPDLKEFTIKIVEKYNKHVVLYGLSGDSNREQFGQIIDLIPYADEIRHLKAYCLLCRDMTPAIFTKRISNDVGQILIGGSESYIPVCRKHYLN